jgi:predicted ester cyclase
MRRSGQHHALVVIFAVATLAGAACGGLTIRRTSESAMFLASSTPAGADLVDRTDGLVAPAELHVAPGTDVAEVRGVIHTAQLLYTFWNTGDSSYLDQAIVPSFVDNTLPVGRPQGPEGPRAASAKFRAAVPDLTCELADLYVTGDTFTARLVFQGHFSGTYDGVRGQGQPIAFNAIDIQQTGTGSRITQDWHLEDNLTFLQQAGLVRVN